VKLRGYRIELGEIESVLSGYAGIAQCVVLMHAAKEQDQKHLVAYYVLDAGTDELTKEALRSYLQTRLPAYMVPSFFVQLEAIPLTVNGKIDRKALPEPDVRGQIAQGYVEPRNEIEKRLVEIWKQVLGVNKVGIYDNFFELGGNSLWVW
jgi:acyl-coenzyme A synthetase/AMP-(fatty) acid ligase